MSLLHPLTMRVAALTRETADAVTIYLEDPTGKPLPAYRAGQYLTLILPVPDPANGGRPVRRAYSLSSAPHENACAVTVKRVAGGLASTYLVEQLRPGQLLEILPPLGAFTADFQRSQARQFVLVGGGSGITPLLSIAKTVLREEPASQVLLVYANRDRASTIFREQLAALAAAAPGRLTVEHVLETGPADYTGQFSAATLQQVLHRRRLANVRQALYFLCGPEGLMNAARTALDELGVPPTQIQRESFTASTVAAPPAPVEPQAAATPLAREVKIQYEGRDYRVLVGAQQSILEAGLDAGIDLPYSCQAGLCTACRGRCHSGAVRMDERDGLSDGEIAKGYVLLCVGHPTTDDVVIEIG